MKIHRLELIILDPNQEEESLEDIKIDIENMSDRIVHFIKEETRDDGKEWDDDSHFNFGIAKAERAWKRLKK